MALTPMNEMQFYSADYANMTVKTSTYSAPLNYTMLEDGYVKATLQRTAAGNTTLKINNSEIVGVGTGSTLTIFLPLKKNDILAVVYSTSDTHTCYFSFFGLK